MRLDMLKLFRAVTYEEVDISFVDKQEYSGLNHVVLHMENNPAHKKQQ